MEIKSISRGDRVIEMISTDLFKSELFFYSQPIDMVVTSVLMVGVRDRFTATLHCINVIFMQSAVHIVSMK